MKVVLYIASALDGKIAMPDGSCAWLDSVRDLDGPAADYGYQGLLDSTSTILVGRKTLSDLSKFVDKYPYERHHTIVFSRATEPSRELRQFLGECSVEWSDDPVGRVRRLRDVKKSDRDVKESDKDSWLMGGGEIAATLMNAGLVDRLVWSIHPSLLGEGVPLWASSLSVTRPATLIDMKRWPSGLVQLQYDFNK